MARADLEVYGWLTRQLKAYPHHKGIIEAVQPKTWNKGQAVVCPPGSGKSTWISEIGIAWLIAKNPDKFILHIHANDDKADAYLKVVQQTFEDSAAHKEIWPDVEPDYDRGWSGKGLYFRWRDKTGKWSLVTPDGWAHLPSKDPQYMSIGFWGSSIGRRCDYIILDDPFDPQEVESPAWRIKFARRFKLVIKSRLKPGGRIIFICNRWHHDDIVPVLQDMGYSVVTFPAIKMLVLADGTEQEESYCPDMWSLADLKDLQRDLGEIDFNCLYQGDPSGVDGAIIKRKWFKYYRMEGDWIIIKHEDDTVERIHRRELTLFQAIDPAASVKTSADYFVICTCGRDRKGRIFVLDVIRKRLIAPEQPGLMKEAYLKWHPYAQGAEKVAYQLSLIQYAAQLGLPIKELPRFGDKLSRHKTLAARIQAGTVFFLLGAAWLGTLELELTRLPKSANDDQADALSDAVEELSISSSRFDKKQLEDMNKPHSRVFASMRF